MAILIFQIFTLGKHPFTCRGQESIAQAIKDNDFVYPIGDEDNSRVPLGNWPYVWYELPISLQTNFQSVFRRNEKIALDEWIDDLQEYQRQIQLGESNRAIRPRGDSGINPTINLNRRDITDKETHLRTALTILTSNSKTKIGILELSTKAVKLLVARVDDQDLLNRPFSHNNFYREAYKTETGRGLDSENNMDMDYYFPNKVAKYIRDLVVKARQCGVTHLYTVATAAYRSANNRESIAEYLRHQIGLNLCILTKAEEARSTIMAYFHSTSHRAELLKAKQVMIIDQGGGSTEVNLFRDGGQGLGQSYSINLGTTALRNLLVRENRDGALLSGALRKSKEVIRRRLMAIDNKLEVSGDAIYCIGVGSAITLATGLKGNKQQHEYLFTVESLQQVAERAEQDLLGKFRYVTNVLVASESYGQRSENSVDSQLTIVLGIPMIIDIMKRFGVTQLRVSGTGLWYGQYYDRLYEQK